MSNQDQKVGPGGHYSGKNRIPNIKQFVESLDRDKAERDKQIREREKAKEGDGIKPHVSETKGEAGTQKTVTDPTTGNEVVIENVNEDFMKAVENPQITVPNANLGQPTVSISRQFL